ncbi:MAG: hypothetical protein KA791_07855 [Flavobacteriales bacterium]|nr:hypothetical protein [Flavobacteriales bacterium]
MLRLYIPLGLIAVFVGYVLYLLILKKDRKHLKAFLHPGLLFIGIWVVLYYWLR